MSIKMVFLTIQKEQTKWMSLISTKRNPKEHLDKLANISCNNHPPRFHMQINPISSEITARQMISGREIPNKTFKEEIRSIEVISWGRLKRISLDNYLKSLLISIAIFMQDQYSLQKTFGILNKVKLREKVGMTLIFSITIRRVTFPNIMIIKSLKQFQELKTIFFLMQMNQLAKLMEEITVIQRLLLTNETWSTFQKLEADTITTTNHQNLCIALKWQIMINTTSQISNVKMIAE